MRLCPVTWQYLISLTTGQSYNATHIIMVIEKAITESYEGGQERKGLELGDRMTYL